METIKRSNEIKNWPLENINKINKPLFKSVKRISING